MLKFEPIAVLCAEIVLTTPCAMTEPIGTTPAVRSVVDGVLLIGETASHALQLSVVLHHVRGCSAKCRLFVDDVSVLWALALGEGVVLAVHLECLALKLFVLTGENDVKVFAIFG